MAAEPERLMVFALAASAEIGAAVGLALCQPLARHEERDFEDGEHKARPLDPVRGADVYVIHSLHGELANSANDKLCRLLFFIGALKDAGAARVTAVAPYLCYARKDRRTKPNDPVTTRYIAGLFEAVGTDAIITLDVHNPVAFENAFRCRTIALTAAPLFVDYAKALPEQRFAVISPDAGGAKRAELFREALEAALGRPVGKGITEKHRSAGVVSGDLFIDCSGFSGALINKHYGTEFVGFGDSLFNDRAVALRVPYERLDDPVNPFTTSTAVSSGWIWDIPLSDQRVDLGGVQQWSDNSAHGRRGVGYVYSSQFITDEQAERELREYVGRRAEDVDAPHGAQRDHRDVDKLAEGAGGDAVAVDQDQRRGSAQAAQRNAGAAGAEAAAERGRHRALVVDGQRLQVFGDGRLA